MRKDFFVSFSVPREQGDRFKQFMKDIDCLEFWEEPHNERALPHLYHTFSEKDPRLAALRKLLKREGIKWREREEHEYTEEELRNSPLLIIASGLTPLDAGGPRYGTTYDFSNACPKCGTGAVQTSALMLPMSRFPKKSLLCEAAHYELLVAGVLADALRKAEVTGLELRQVLYYRNNEPLPWWQMISTYTMPQFSPQTRGIITEEKDYVDETGLVIRAMPPCPQWRRRPVRRGPCRKTNETANPYRAAPAIAARYERSRGIAIAMSSRQVPFAAP